jgi:hypothetical protein
VTEPSEYRFCQRCGDQHDSRDLKAGEPPRLVSRACAFVFSSIQIATGIVFSYDSGSSWCNAPSIELRRWV